MTSTATIDPAGRIVIPKPLRDALRLSPGDRVEVSSDDTQLTLRPVRQTAPLVKEMGIWVYRSGTPVSETEAEQAISRARDERSDAVAG